MKSKLIHLLLIFFLAFFLRGIVTEVAPPSLNWDEVSHGYNAYSIAKTGKDEWGQQWPVTFKAYGDYKLPVYIYLTAISQAVFGLGAFGVRFVSILAGSLLVIVTYFLTNYIFRSSKTAILASLLVALEPWGFFVSRIASEANLSVLFVSSGVLFFLLGIKERSYYFLLSSLSFGLAVWTYNSARFFVPVIFLLLAFIYYQEIKRVFKVNKGLILISFFTLCVFVLPMILQLFLTSGQARYQNVAIIDEGAIAKIVEMRNGSQLQGVFPRLVHNKLTYFASEFVKNYFSHFSPQFLFTKGGSHFQFSLPDHGLIHWIHLPFLVVGLLLVIRNFKKSNEYKILLIWLILAPVASSITREAPHALRSLVILPIPMILIAHGLTSTLARLNKSFVFIFFLGYIVLYGLSLEKYYVQYFNNYPKKYSWVWQYGYEPLGEYLGNNYSNYEKIIITKKYGEPHEFLLYYRQWDPSEYQKDDQKISFAQSNWWWVDKFDKFYFVNDWQIPRMSSLFELESKKETVDCSKTNQRCLLVSSPGNAPNNWNMIQEIKFLDGKTVFEIYEN